MQNQEIPKPLPQSADQFLDHESHGFKQASIKYEIVTADGFNVYLFGTVGISRCNSFTVKFHKMQHGGGLGFVDSKLKGSSYIANQLNVVTYRSDGTCRTGSITKEKAGKGFESYDEVTVSVNQSTGEIVWSIGNKVLNSAQYDKIKDKDIDWVPYIRLCDKGDKMEILFDHEKSQAIAKEIFKS